MSETTPVVPEKDSATELDSFRIECSKHKDVTNATVSLNFASKGAEGAVKEFHYIYCLACLNEVLLGFQKEGKIGKVTITPVYKPVETPPAETAGVEDAGNS